jgi:hypothetical protein
MEKKSVGLDNLVGATVVSHKYDHGALHEDYELKFEKDGRTFVLEIEEEWDTEGHGSQLVRAYELVK